MMELSEVFVPPLRFGCIQENLYRGGYPRKVNFAFLASLNIKTIVSLTPDPIDNKTDENLYKFAEEQGIRLVHIECAQSGKGKKRGVPMGYTAVLQALDLMIHEQNSPLYIHCLNGGQVSSLIVACLRKVQFWSSIAIFNEFINYTTSITVNDRSFVDGFEGVIEVNNNDKVTWLWMGLSKGIISSHPSITFKDRPSQGNEEAVLNVVAEDRGERLDS